MASTATGMRRDKKAAGRRLQGRTWQDLSRLESRLIRWMVGIFLTFLALLGALVTLPLPIAGLRG